MILGDFACMQKSSISPPGASRTASMSVRAVRARLYRAEVCLIGVGLCVSIRRQPLAPAPTVCFSQAT